MSYNFHKKIRSLQSVLKNCFRPELPAKRSSICFITDYSANLRIKSLPKFATNQIRKVSSSNLIKSNDSNVNENGSKDEQNRKVLDDIEFKNILSDFAKDFGVGSESEQILEDIRKKIDDPSIDGQTKTQDQGKEFDPVYHKKVLNNTTTGNKFKEFSESDAVVIPSYEDIVSEPDSEFIFHIDQGSNVLLLPEEVKRGVHGVFDIDELVEALRKENVLDITAISVPEDIHYTDFLVLATAKSPRHSIAVCENIKKLYKLKKHIKDPFVIVEGGKESDWKALDLGNIVLHIFLEETRVLYDIESLWLFDPEFDKGRNMKTDPMYESIQEQLAFFNALNDSTSGESTHKNS